MLALASITALALESFFVTRLFLGALGLGAGGGGGVAATAGDLAAITIGESDLFTTLIGGGVGAILGIFEGGRAGMSSGVCGLTIGDIDSGGGGTLAGPELTSIEDSTELDAFKWF